MTTALHDLEGATGKLFTMPVELGKVIEFARATSVTGSRDVDVHDGDVVPPTFLQTAMLWDVEGSNPFYDSGLRFERLLHGQQEFEFVDEPPRVGDVLTVRRRIEKVFDKAGKRSGKMTFVVEVTEFRNDVDAIVCIARNTRIITETSATANKVSAPPPPPVSDGRRAVTFTAPPLTINDAVRYQGASGDYNPIHHDIDFARAAGYPQPFAVGMRQAGLLADHATSWLGVHSIRRFSIRFRAQAWPGDALTYALAVAPTSESEGEQQITLDLRCTRPDGTVHLDGQAKFQKPPDHSHRTLEGPES